MSTAAAAVAAGEPVMAQRAPKRALDDDAEAPAAQRPRGA
jgi:hypothetical protein